MKRLLTLVSVIGFIMASFMTPLNAQWNPAYNGPQGVGNLYFVDSMHGWFVTSPSMGTDKILRTTDGGYTFETQYVPSATFNLYSVFFEDTLNGWAAGGPYDNGPGTILKTTDGGNTWDLKIPPTPQCGWSIITKTGNTILFGGGYDENGGGGILLKTTNNGDSWLPYTQYPISSGGGRITDLVAFDAQTYIVSGDNGFLARTTNGGVSWLSAGLPNTYQAENIAFLDNLLGYALITDWTNMWDTKEYLYVTSNGGISWNPRYSWIDGAQKCALSVIPGTSIIFVGGYWGTTANDHGILKSTDSGFTWNIELQITYPIFAIQTPDVQHAWATGGYIYRYDYQPPAQIARTITLNQGWNMISMPVDQPVKSAEMIFPNMIGIMYGFNGLQYYSASEMDLGHGYWLKNSVAETIDVVGPEIDITSVYFSTGGWQLLGSISTKICRSCLHTNPDSSIVGTIFGYEVAYIPADTLYPGEGYWVKLSQPCTIFLDRYYVGELTPISPELIQQQLAELPPAPDAVTEVQPEPTPTEFALEQNYPNPFNPVTTISYSVPSASFVQLVVYDITGQEVATLVARELPPGSYTAEFIGTDLPSGIYFYQLRAGSFQTIKKMVLLK